MGFFPDQNTIKRAIGIHEENVYCTDCTKSQK